LWPVTDAAPTDDVFRVLAHDLLNSLTVIGGYAATLRVAGQNGSTELALQCAEVIERHSAQMEGLIRSSQDVRLLERGGMELAFQPLDVVEVVDEAVAALAGPLGDRTVSVSGPSGARVVVSADRNRFRQAVSAVISNAAKFSPAGSAIDVLVSSADGAARIEVRDEGPGIPPDAREKVFEKFGRLSHRVPGSGLNLFVAREIIRLHGGDISVVDSDHGATFCFNLPIAGQTAEGGHDR
jgi:signal transduction histidine kinase